MPLFLMRPTIEYYGILKILERKFWTHEIPTRKNLGPTKHSQEKTLDSRNTHGKKIETHDIPTRKNFGPTKYPRRHEGAMTLDPRDP